MADQIYSLPALLSMLREPCEIEKCGHCHLERQAADEIERLQRARSVAVARANRAAHDLANLACENESGGRESEAGMTLDDYECRTCHAIMYVPEGMDDLDEDVRFCPSCAIGEIERLRAIVERLPKTADGVPIVPAMRLWYFPPELNTLRSTHAPRQASVMDRVYSIEDSDDFYEIETYDCYSTREAAELERLQAIVDRLQPYEKMAIADERRCERQSQKEAEIAAGLRCGGGIIGCSGGLNCTSDHK